MSGNSLASQVGVVVAEGRSAMMGKFWVRVISTASKGGWSQGMVLCMDAAAACLATGFVMLLCQGSAP
jgi:hypothetical protein